MMIITQLKQQVEQIFYLNRLTKLKYFLKRKVKNDFNKESLQMKRDFKTNKIV